MRRPPRVPALHLVRHFRALLARSILALACLGATAGVAGAQTIQIVHRSSAGTLANGSAEMNSAAAVSDDGRWIAFASDATNLVVGDTNGMADIFVRDRTTNTTVRVSVSGAGAQADAFSIRPSISADGRYVVFQSSATNLVAGDTNALPDVFRRDRDTDADGIYDEPGAVATIRVSVTLAGAEANGASRCYGHALSNDGDVMVFESDATNLVGGDTNLSTDCFARRVSLLITKRVSLRTGGGEAPFGAGFPSLSGDGRYVLMMEGTADGNLDLADANGIVDIYRFDTATFTQVRLSDAPGGVQSNGTSIAGSLSDDGDRVTFTSMATNLVAGDDEGFEDVFVRTISTATTIRASQRFGGEGANASSYAPVLSGDGDVVAFLSPATDFVAGSRSGGNDLYALTLSSGARCRAARAVNGTAPNAGCWGPDLSTDGDVVGFASGATDLVAGDGNGVPDVFVRTAPFAGAAYPASPADPVRTARTPNPVSFSVAGPVGPHSDGICSPRGGLLMPATPPIPGNPYAAAMRFGPVLQAAGLNSPIRPGDVFDYASLFQPSEAVLFESAPPSPAAPGGAPPDGTNNQVLVPSGLGLAPGLGLPQALFTTVPPGAPLRDDVDALSFGSDYFPDTLFTGFAGMDTLPMPPILPDGDLAVVGSAWDARFSLYAEPIVTYDGRGIVFEFSVDPWSTGAAGSAVALDAGIDTPAAGGMRYTSFGEAAGDVFESLRLSRFGGMTVGGGSNLLLDDNNALALAPDSLTWPPMEDDLDALESTGPNVSWLAGMPATPGDLHARLIHVDGIDPSPVGLANHAPWAYWPVFFSVRRNSPGQPFTAVRSQFVLDGGAAADIFVASSAAAFPPVPTNLLFIDNEELGLMDTDDLDGLILWVAPSLRPLIAETIASMSSPDTTGGTDGALTGPGMTYSITRYLGIPRDSIRVGFSVTSDAVGMEYTAVEWEAAPISPPGGRSAACGDVFFARPDGTATNTNWLWYEGTDLGLDEGSNVLTTFPSLPGALGTLSDELDGLDSSDTTFATHTVGVERGNQLPPRLLLAPPAPSPFQSAAVIRFGLPMSGEVQVTVHDVQGRLVRALGNGRREAGWHRVVWDGRDESGGSTPAGVYFVQVRSPGGSAQAKLVHVR